MARSTNFKILAVAVIGILAIVLISFPSSPVTLYPKANTGVFLAGCAYDSEGNVLGCSYSQKAPLGQSVLTGFGGSPSLFGIPSAYVKVDYTGQVSSWSFTAREVIQYEKGVSETYPMGASGTGNPAKVFNITLPKSSWTSNELQSKFLGFGQKLVNASVTSCSWTFTFVVNSLKVIKPCAYDYFVQFKLDYGETTTTTTSSSTTTQTTTTTTTQTTSIETTTTSSSSTVSGGDVVTGTTDVWTTTITAASGGQTGNTAANGIIVTLAPDYYFASTQSVVNAYVPLSLCSAGFFATVVTPSQSVTVGRIPSETGPWFRIAFSTVVVSGSPYLVQITCASSIGTYLFNQVVTASIAQPSNLPPPPYDQLTQTQTTTTTTDISAFCSSIAQQYPSSNPPASCPGHVGLADRLSIISITF